MTDEETEGRFQWVSGAKMAYTNWAAGEPNNAGNGENYGRIEAAH